MRYIKLYRSFLVNMFKRETDYKAAFLGDIVDNVLNIFITVAFFRVIYGNIYEEVTWEEILLLIGISKLVTAILYSLFMNNLPRLQRLVLYKDLDTILLLPCDTQFYVSFRYFYFGGISGVVSSLFLIAYSLFVGSVLPNIQEVFGIIILIGASVAILYSLWLMLMCLTFYVLKIEGIYELFITMLTFIEFPQFIYKNGVRYFFLFILPIIIIANFPTELLLGRLPISDFIFAIIIAFLFFSVARLVWRMSLKRYVENN